jgi:hypothetical protein
MADLYLIKAEALTQYLLSPAQKVYDAINKVRCRAGISDIKEVWADPALVKTVDKHKTEEGMIETILRERDTASLFRKMKRYR